jgi:hypothetical protein
VDLILNIFKLREKFINNSILCGKNIINADLMISKFIKLIEEMKIECLYDT